MARGFVPHYRHDLGRDYHGMEIMTGILRSIASWVTEHWPGLLIPLILLCGAAMVRTATIWAIRRTR